MANQIRYTVVIPVYNEEAVLCETYRRLTAVMGSMGEPYELLFINDGSTDGTQLILQRLCQHDDCIQTLEFSRNFGHQAAITAGLDYARGDAVVIIDADLQDPPEVIPLMISKWREGFEVVYGKRLQRKGEKPFKKWTAALFYRILRSLTEIDIPIDTGDFRLMDRKVCEVLKVLREHNRFVRGLVSWAGFRQTAVEYVREGRYAGETKYVLRKMLCLSMDGITSFSHQPLKIASSLGLALTLASSVYLLIWSVKAIRYPGIESVWAAAAAGLFLFNGFIMILIGIMGEYIGRIIDDVKDRPLYILRDQPRLQPARPKEVNWHGR